MAILEVKPALEVTAEEYALQMSTNLESAFHLSQLSHPLLKVSARGRIVFISSIAAQLVSAIPLSVYSMTKGQSPGGLNLRSLYRSLVPASNC